MQKAGCTGKVPASQRSRRGHFYPEKQIANWAAIRYTADHIHDYIEVDDSHAIFEVEVPGDWIGKTIGELDIRKKYSISILAIKTDGKMNMRFSGYGIKQ